MAKVTNGGSECRTIARALADKGGRANAPTYGALRSKLGLNHMGVDRLRACLRSMARMHEVRLVAPPGGRITVSLPD